MGDRQPLGMLVYSESGDLGPLSVNGRPCGMEAGRLLLPIDAAIEPPVAAKEWVDLLDTAYRYVWLPENGLTKFGRQEQLR